MPPSLQDHCFFCFAPTPKSFKGQSRTPKPKNRANSTKDFVENNSRAVNKGFEANRTRKLTRKFVTHTHTCFGVPFLSLSLVKIYRGTSPRGNVPKSSQRPQEAFAQKVGNVLRSSQNFQNFRRALTSLQKSLSKFG